MADDAPDGNAAATLAALRTSPPGQELLAAQGVAGADARRQELLAARDAARAFFQRCWDRVRDGGEIDGADVQEWGEAHGLLVPVPVAQPCGEGCVCDEMTDTWPTTCYRVAWADPSP